MKAKLETAPTSGLNMHRCFIKFSFVTFQSWNSEGDYTEFGGFSYEVAETINALRVSKEIRAGIVFVNTYRLISPSAPFGGLKDSGYGKEAGLESIKDYTRIKTTWFNTSEKSMADPFTMG